MAVFLPVQRETVENSAVFCPIFFKTQKKGSCSTFFFFPKVFFLTETKIVPVSFIVLNAAGLFLLNTDRFPVKQNLV